MYSLMLVDDEYDVRKAILETICWNELGFEVVGEAENGREALDVAQRLNPDVIITDIKMPFMDGIEFVKVLREENPITKIVFLTGFNDFEYAKTAIQFNVMEYLLKPISADNLSKTLTSIRKKLDEERDALRDIERMKKNYETDRRIMRMGFLHALVAGGLTKEYIVVTFPKLGLQLDGECNLVFVTKPSRHSLETNTLGVDDTDLLMSSISKLITQIADRYAHNETFWHLDHIVTILSDNRKTIDANSDMLMLEIQQNMEHFYGISSTIGVSEKFDEVSKIRLAYESALSALDYRLILGRNRIIHIGDIEPDSKVRFLFDESNETTLKSILKTGTKEQVSKFINRMFENMRRHKATISDYQIYIIEMFSVVVKTAKSLIPDFDLNVGNNLNFITDIFTHESIDDVKLWFERLCHRVMEYINLQRQDSADILAGKGYEYIKKNYQASDLSLKSVSEQLHISPSYFSSIFKKSTGDSFTNVLIKIRMENAKELLLSTNKKIFEIAQETGYTDQHYFSYCFKRYFQISPNEMRRGIAEASSGGSNAP
ncbi:response regulator [Hydrogenoanaerobacterium sp.]|uniref:response regulator transcription factor n=1 Tax=Hydrogenoanaerobacterium sp. TaxID=2953763 RepID=UPI00289E1638|nr:response regulator [Hydrogenoanaerobacterium sp.]